jgi:hypothetical protein
MSELVVETIIALRCSLGEVEVVGQDTHHCYPYGCEVLVGRTATGLLVEVNSPNGSGSTSAINGPVSLRLRSPVLIGISEGVVPFPPRNLIRGDKMGGSMVFFGEEDSHRVSIWDNSQPPQTIR